MIGAEVGTEGHILHGSGEPFSQSTWYHHQNGRIFCRGVTVAWQLYDVNEGDGGFAVVPGSHKSQFRTPQGVRTVEDSMGLVVQPVMKAGDILFSQKQRPTAHCLGRAKANDGLFCINMHPAPPRVLSGDFTRPSNAMENGRKS